MREASFHQDQNKEESERRAGLAQGLAEGAAVENRQGLRIQEGHGLL